MDMGLCNWSEIRISYLVDQNATHIRLLSQVSGSLADEEIIEKLLKENDPQKIIELLIPEDEGINA